MGGVYAFEPPGTMPAIDNVLNRLSSATMNQLYHPEYTGKFFDFLIKRPNIKTYLTTNNEVGFIEPTGFTKINFNQFLNSNGLKGLFIKDLAEIFYTQIKSPYKAFDYYVGKSLVQFMNGKLSCNNITGNLFYNNKYGISIYDKVNDNNQAKENYIKQINNFPSDQKNIFKKSGLMKELPIYNTISLDKKIPVINLKFTIGLNKNVTIKCNN